MKFYNVLFFRLFVIVGLTVLCIYLLMEKLPYTAILAGVVTVLFFVEIYFFIRNRILFYDKTIVSILHNDFSSSFPKAYQTGSYQNLYKLYESLRKKEHQQVSREHVYTSILNNVDSAVLILQGNPENWTIFLMNDCFSELFKVPKFSNWDYLKNQLPTFCTEIEKNGFSELKTSINISIDDREAQTFMLQTSMTQSFGESYFIILLDSIQRVIEKKEKEAWINLMKVISHELMNSLTPIRSLSQSLIGIVEQEKLSTEDISDIRMSLGTIMNRSDHLQFFVENYRKLTMLPTPDKKPVDLNKLIAECVTIMTPIFKQSEIEIANEVRIPNAVHADKNQLEQVIINLFTNSIFAVANRTEKKIFVLSATEGNRVFITISDTGGGVEKEIRDKIFLPFFTTRKDGAGIGLTLSKNIIEAHGGYLSHQTENDRTSFVISLIAR